MKGGGEEPGLGREIKRSQVGWEGRRGRRARGVRGGGGGGGEERRGREGGLMFPHHGLGCSKS